MFLLEILTVAWMAAGSLYWLVALYFTVNRRCIHSAY